jgi:ribose/xylose/arabinose/galactoside ABC-type transport system permease subunit
MILGAELLITSGETVTTSSKLYSDLVVKNLGGFLPAAAVVALVIFVLVWILFHRMPFGRHVAAIGGNPKAATDAGINLRAVTVGVFVVSGICAAIAGMMVGAQLQTVDSTVGSGFELTAIAVVVVGGTSLTGGRGNLIGTVIAAFLLEVIHSALQILDVSSLYEDLAFGSILVGALMIDGLRRGASRKGMLVI